MEILRGETAIFIFVVGILFTFFQAGSWLLKRVLLFKLRRNGQKLHHYILIEGFTTEEI